MNYKMIQNRMKEKGYNPVTLSKKSGVPTSTLNKIVYGFSTNPTIENLRCIAKALDLSIDDLVRNEDDPIIVSENSVHYYLDNEAAEMAQELYEREELRVLFDASRNVSKKDIEDVAAILEKLKQK